MKTEFSRVITLLRKENNLTQKKVALDLNITQSLLSHYEKGIRECGLDFVVKVADYYNVSCDYLLGRSYERKGQTINYEDIPDASKEKDNRINAKESILPSLNKKIINNSISILFDIIAQTKSKELVIEVSSCLMMHVYKIFRTLYSCNKKNIDKMFSINAVYFKAGTEASILFSEAKIYALINNAKIQNVEQVKDKTPFLLDNQILYTKYPLYSSSLLNLIQNSEKNIKTNLKLKQ